jgi:ribosome-binding protein aMBF1 (putative translation factor)
MVYLTNCETTGNGKLRCAAPAHRHDAGMSKPAPPARVEFARRLAAARQAAGYDTMRDFAMALGVEEARYGRWERAETEPDITCLRRIAATTHVSLDVLIGGGRLEPLS